MYRRSDPRWNRTLQHLTSNIEHANESAQENIYGFTQRYITPCFSSLGQCVNACTAPCFPAHNDRRRHRTVRGRAESSFDFYDDWEEDETEGLLGWGSENLDRFLGGASTYGTTSQPGRQRAMSYGQRARDPRFNTARRTSTAQARDVPGQDPTLIPSSSYFGFLGRLPFKIGGKGLRYKPSAADLTDNPGAARRSLEEEQPLIEDSDEDGDASEHKGHRRQRSNTHTSGHTADSLSSRGDIFPSEDELDDAVPLDDEFTLVLERRTTGQWNDGASSTNRSAKSEGKSKRPKGTRSASSRSSKGKSEENVQRPDETLDMPTLATLHAEEQRLREHEELAIERKRLDAQYLAVQRGLAPDRPSRSPSPQMRALHSSVSPLVRSPANEQAPFPMYGDGDLEAQTMPDSSGFHVDESDYSSRIGTPRRAASVKDMGGDGQGEGVKEEEFVPARLPNFGAGK
jgi:hypothetical protein